MNSHDTHRQAEPLSPEERALGERLTRLGPHGEPSPALDARILAAAHAAASTPARTHGAPRRWPMALGIAASLTLAVGIAWQLRPVQEATVYDEAASAPAAQADAAAVAQDAAADVAATGQASAAAAAAPPPPKLDARPAQTAAGPRRESQPAVTAPRSAAQRARAAAPAAPAAAEPEVVFEDDAPVDAAVPAPAAPPPAPPSSPASAPTTRAQSTAPAAKAISGDARTQAAERSSAEAAASNASGNAAQSREDAFAEDVPPATADSPEVREAWLQRIRELAEAGETGDARASLQEFVHRYPNHPLPDDLRALLE